MVLQNIFLKFHVWTFKNILENPSRIFLKDRRKLKWSLVLKILFKRSSLIGWQFKDIFLYPKFDGLLVLKNIFFIKSTIKNGFLALHKFLKIAFRSLRDNI